MWKPTFSADGNKVLFGTLSDGQVLWRASQFDRSDVVVEGGREDGPRVLKEQQAACLHANVGDADPDIAVPALIRMLENYSSGSLAIEAVVFGLDPDTKFVV